MNRLFEVAIETADGVFHARCWGLELGEEVLAELKVSALNSVRGSSRLCLHPRVDDDHQEMLIVYSRGFQEVPQRRTNGFDTKVVMEGSGTITYFDELGLPTRSLELGGSGSFYLHTRSNEYHSIYVDSEFFVFLEVLKGPFESGTTERAAWYRS